MVSLILPWWSESESYGGSQWLQVYSPLTGVTGSCRPSCPTLWSGPPVGPIEGKESFASAGLRETGRLYAVALALVAGGMAFAVAVATHRWRFVESVGPPRGRRTLLLHVLSLVGVAAGTAALPLFQSTALRADTMGMGVISGNGWTASPSPETSFWGSCEAGTYHGLCASGGSAEWGPGLGWILLLAAVVLLLVLLARSTGEENAGGAPAEAPLSETAQGTAAGPGTPPVGSMALDPGVVPPRAPEVPRRF